MDADTVLEIKPALTEYLHGFDGCLGRVTNRSHIYTCREAPKTSHSEAPETQPF